MEPSEQPARYIVGIDLGTTNSAVAFVDTEASPRRVETFLVPQVVAPAQTERRETLPSFHYEATEAEAAAGALKLPWPHDPRKWTVGFFARDRAQEAPGHVVVSAKSWLCHAGVDRTADILPWRAADEVERLSPITASARYLQHIREAWDAKFRDFPLAEQEIVLTLPASFDEVARDLTVRAARLAGLPRVVLLEEPQAAFYAWIDSTGDAWQTQVQPGAKILVADIGGGTSDFTLIRVRAGNEGKVQFHRIAVGEHLILGGDNLDLAIAHHLEPKLAAGGKLEPRQWSSLVRIARQAKETLLGEKAPEQFTVHLPGSGSRLIGGGLQVEASRAEIEALVLEGFLPRVALEDKPAARQSGFQEFGLPYASDPAITRYLAQFLSRHRHTGLAGDEPASGADPARPDVVLFNGGFFYSPALRDRLLEVLHSWFPSNDAKDPWKSLVLNNERLDLAVAHGAAYYGLARRGLGVRISASLARTYYVGVETDAGEGQAAMCLAPAGIEPGDEIDLSSRKFKLLVDTPVEFPLYVSSTRLTDPAGEIVPFDAEQMTALPPIRTVLQTRKRGEQEAIDVSLHAKLTEVGALELWCGEIGGKREWKLQFDVRAASQTDRAAHQGEAERQGFLDSDLLARASEVIRATLGQKASAQNKPQSVVKQLEESLGMRRGEWPSSLLRAMWDVLIDIEAARRLSAEHEERWLYLVGFCLRPGYGLALHDWRVAQTWRLLWGKRAFHTPACRSEWLILWRRVAGGLTAGWQRTLAEPLLVAVRPASAKRKTDPKLGPHELAETWRLLGSLELLPIDAKTALGGAVLDALRKEKSAAVIDAGIWTVGRLGARVPIYGPLNTVVPPEFAAEWIRRLMSLDHPDSMASWFFPITQLARRTGDRYRDIPDSLRGEIAEWLEVLEAPSHYARLVREGGRLEAEEERLAFGESLPGGLRLEG